MNGRFKLSLVANGILALLLVWLVRARSGSPDRPAAPVTAVPVAAVPGSTFCWSQLESPDYHVFIQNLRRIACPENTIRLIVTRDVEAAFAYQRQKLQVKETAPGPWSRQAEKQWIASLLGDPSLAVPAAEPVPPTPLGQPNLRPWLQQQPPPSWPLIFAPVDSAQLDLTLVQQQVIGQLQQQFITEIGPNSDTNDPAYLTRWQQAQAKIDQSLRGLLGSQFYLQLQLAARNQPTAP